MEDNFAQRIQEAIESTGLSRAEFARRSGVAHPRIHLIINGETPRPSIDTVAKIAETAGVSIDWLVTGKGGDEERVAGHESDEEQNP